MKILIPIDDSAFSILAIHTAMQMAKPLDTEVLILHVVDVLANLSMYDSYGPTIDFEKIEEERLSRAAELVKESAKTIGAAGFTVSSLVERGEPKHVIVDKATEWGADLIVLGSHGRKGVDRFLLGSVSDAVVRHAPCSVYVVRSPQLQSAEGGTKAAKKCAHPTCTCIPREGKYCGAACEATETMPDIDCRCSHPECKGRAH